MVFALLVILLLPINFILHLNMKIKIDGYYPVPSPRERFERDIKYVIGFYRGSSFIGTAHTDNYDLAVEKYSDLCFRHPDRDYHIIEVNFQAICLV